MLNAMIKNLAMVFFTKIRIYLHFSQPASHAAETVEVFLAAVFPFLWPVALIKRQRQEPYVITYRKQLYSP